MHSQTMIMRYYRIDTRKADIATPRYTRGQHRRKESEEENRRMRARRHGRGSEGSRVGRRRSSSACARAASDKPERSSRKTSWLYGSDVRPSWLLLTRYKAFGPNITVTDNLSSVQPYSRSPPMPDHRARP